MFECHKTRGAPTPPPKPPPPPPPPPPPGANLSPPSEEPIQLNRNEQPRVLVQILDNKSISGIDWQKDGIPVPMCDGESGPYRARMFEALPLVESLIREYEPAQNKPNRKDGTPYDQGFYLTSYNICFPTFTSDKVYDDFMTDPDMRDGYSFSSLDVRGFRQNKQSPRLLQNLGIIRYRQQVCASIAMIDGDNSDLWPKSDPRYKDWYASPDPSVIEKLPWNEERMKLFKEEVLPQLLEKESWVKKAACFYTTENGWRLVFCLDRPIPVTGCSGCLEDILLGMMTRLAIAGVGVDTGCKDWTRNMRVPKCYKGTRAIWKNPFFRLSWNGIDIDAEDSNDPPEFIQAFDPRTLPTYSTIPIRDYIHHANWYLIRKTLYGMVGDDGKKRADWGELDIDIDLGSMPDDEEVRQLLYLEGSEKHTNEWTNIRAKIKKYTEGQKKIGYRTELAKRLFPLLFEGAPNLEEFAKVRGMNGLHYGNYYATWDLCTVLREVIPSPQMIYALMVEPYLTAMQKRAETDSKNARSEASVKQEAWRAVVRHYPVQVAINIQQEKDREEEAQRREGHSTTSQDDIRASLLIQDQLEKWTGMSKDWIETNWRHHLLVSSILGVSVLQIKDDKVSYSNPVSSKKEWVTHVAKSGHTLINLYDTSEEPKIRPEDDLFYNYGVSCGKIVKADRLIDRNQITYIREGGEMIPCFIQKLPGLAEDIEPHYHADVEEYLHLIGGKHTETFLDWFWAFTQIDQPCPALYLHGASGIGKGMIIDGLTQLTSRKQYAEFKDAMGNFQDFYEDTFFLIVDEGTDSNNFQKDVVSVLRRMIGGQLRQLNLKGVKGIHVNGEWRLMAAANNSDLFQIKHDLTEQDIDALNGRIFYLDANKNTAAIKAFLKRQGGRHGNEQGPGTVATQWPRRIAEYVMWLRQNREVKKGDRFLIDAPKTPWHDQMRVTSAGGLTICQAIQGCMELVQRQQYTKAIHIDPKKSKVYIKAEEFETFVEKNFPRYKGQVTKTLQRLAKGAPERVRIPQEGKLIRNCPRHYMYPIDIKAVIGALHAHGYETDFRDVFGVDMWAKVVPKHIRDELKDVDIPEPPPSPEPPPPPGRPPAETPEARWVQNRQKGGFENED